MPPESDVRQHPDRPIVGVGVVVWRGDSFLLVRRGKEPNKGQWSIPGGAQHLGETVYAAAEREVLEETGLQVTVHGLVDVVDGIRRDSEGRVNYHYTLVDVVADSPSGEARAADDAEAVGWFTLEDLPGLGLWSETERIIRESVSRRQSQSAVSQ
jgi:ADP-ribose pyrophosphatase YjhB (NUDIX family)